jgi:dTDP-4-dehydrorhamnose reductase
MATVSASPLTPANPNPVTLPIPEPSLDSQGGQQRIAILGAGGQLGCALTRTLAGRAVPLTRADADLTRIDEAIASIDRLRPDCVINAAAYTNVDAAESENQLAFQVNGLAPGRLASWCAGNRLPFLHISTDYVFSGAGNTPWKETDEPDPINTYGRSKLEGERQVMASGGRWLIFRTSWVYDDRGRNFLTTILRLARERETLSIVDDQRGAPTYAADLAAGVVEAMDRASADPVFPSGVYHMCNSGVITWYGFATAIVDAARAKGESLKVRSIAPIRSSDYPTTAKRPLNSRLCTSELERTFGIRLPDWASGLRDCFAALPPAVSEGT